MRASYLRGSRIACSSAAYRANADSRTSMSWVRRGGGEEGGGAGRSASSSRACDFSYGLGAPSTDFIFMWRRGPGSVRNKAFPYLMAA